MGRRWENRWFWVCNAEDHKHGCWSADFDGRCNGQSRKGFKTKEEAEAAALLHEQRANHPSSYAGVTKVYKKRVYL